MATPSLAGIGWKENGGGEGSEAPVHGNGGGTEKRRGNRRKLFSLQGTKTWLMDAFLFCFKILAGDCSMLSK